MAVRIRLQPSVTDDELGRTQNDLCLVHTKFWTFQKHVNNFQIIEDFTIILDFSKTLSFEISTSKFTKLSI